MSSLDIAPHPEDMPGKPLTRHRMRRRLRVSFRRAEACAFWRLGFRQFSFHHIARVPWCAVPDTWTRPPVSWHALVPASLSASGKPSDPRTFLQSFPAEPGIQRSASRRTGFAPTRRGMRPRAGVAGWWGGFRLALKAVHNVSCSFAACSGGVAVAGRASSRSPL